MSDMIREIFWFVSEVVVFVVTGGGRGIGQALALALAARGHKVLIVGRSEHELAQTALMSSLIQYVCADVSSSQSRLLIQDALQDVPAIQGLIHNAGIIEPILPITTIDELSWKQMMATNVDAPLFLTQLLARKLNNGRVLNVGSGAGFFPVKAWTAYCVSKAALAMLTRCWQLESNDCAFAYVMPGIIDTQMQATIRHADHMQDEKRNFFKQLKQDNRLITAETVAAFLCWLLLDIDTQLYESNVWDIYDTSHHPAWLFEPNAVPALE